MDIIVQQVKQIANSYLIRNINTNDRIIDSAIVLIVLALFDVIFHFLKNNLHNYFSKENINVGKEPWDFDTINVQCDTIENIIKYKYIIYLDCLPYKGKISTEKISDKGISFLAESKNSERIEYMKLIKIWIEKFSKISFPININGSTNLYFKNNTLFGMEDGVDDYAKHHNIFMPLWYYKNGTKYEYIYMYDDKLYSNDIVELNKFTDHFLNYVNSITVAYNKCYDNLTIDVPNKEKSRDLYESPNKQLLKTNCIVNTKKTFDTLYIDNKQEIIDLIDKFKNNTMYPSTYHLDNKLGLLLHGPPGTGKSGFVTCLANKLGRSILLIESLNEKRDDILLVINECKKTHIIVLDEFDKLLENIGNFDACDYTSLFALATPEERKDIINKMSINRKSEMSDIMFLMKLLDSFGDDSGRVIVATTNHPEKIHASLVRPGRFDKIICMSYCTLGMFTDIVRGSFDNINELLENDGIKNKVIQILKLNITPLVLINTCVTSKTFDEVVNKLENMKQKHYDHEIKDDE